MALKVIGAGFGRTGTTSLKRALEALGFGKCYHMVELLENKHQIAQWENALKKKEANWDSVFSGYQAAVDFPACFYYEQLMAYYPEAKVILTERSPESWYESAYKTMLKAEPSPLQRLKILMRYPFSRNVRNFVKITLHNQEMFQRIFDVDADDDEKCMLAYMQHNERVKAMVPPERLLVYNIKQGWEPLCAFLGVPAPDAEFPRTHQKENLLERLKVSI